ncbi:MAG: Na(+)-translocating NADH-quinone reductase subunit A [Bacteroidales bacterium]|jgi:Na+-transporting NADH:ubiquinone oxidoreductase subunit A|nr:Na(+)-translocating NADH-quinone reductase subunit A [Bacteroidales bacterium]
MSKHFKFKRGFDIRLKGAPERTVSEAPAPITVALKPTDFVGLTPKLRVKPGDAVLAGDPLFFDKYNPEILFTSPVSGTVKDIVRGERRKILEVVVEPDGKQLCRRFELSAPDKMSREQIRNTLLRSGLWPFLKRRPYGTMARPDETPRDIFISGFDSAPLAPDYDFIFKGERNELMAGIEVLRKLTDGKIWLGLAPKQANGVLSSLLNVEVSVFEGPHPAGNVGVQIHHTAPVNKGEAVWTISVQGLAVIGRLFTTGLPDFSITVALTGSEVIVPQYYKTVMGAELGGLFENRTKKLVNERYISGNVLTGTQVPINGYLGFYDQTTTVIPEGDDYELLGWALPGINKFSGSSTFLAKLFPKKEYTLDANMHGGERAFVLTGQYEKYLPMDVLPVYLLKAILVGDIDRMEQLGIYEVIEEDLALCEYGDTSKIKVQKILRDGIDLMVKELG